VSVPGAKIEMFERDTYAKYAATAETWMQNHIKRYDGNPYQYLVDLAKLAQKDGVIKGILLHQGESNPGDKEWPNKVKGIYENLLKDLHLKAEEVPLLAGETVNADQEGRCAGFNKILAELPKTLPNSTSFLRPDARVTRTASISMRQVPGSLESATERRCCRCWAKKQSKRSNSKHRASRTT
jgi:hypothetical protein